ncbi:hypothetical protein NIPOLPBK_04262 [Stenotrophomonas maltophilia]|nr:hypothetical protein NIPOLPBK_04262 [Stenotrophomonas maltophilia]WBL68383.1 hypothetical protein SMAL454_22190 [Stenotrophomonas maltophilia]
MPLRGAGEKGSQLSCPDPALEGTQTRALPADTLSGAHMTKWAIARTPQRLARTSVAAASEGARKENCMQLYKTRAAIRLAERAVIGRTWLWEEDGVPQDSRLIALAEEFLVAPWLVQAGLKVIWQRLVWMVVLTSIVACALWFIEPTFRQEMVIASFIVGATCVYFGLPSRTIFSGLSAKSVASLTKQLNGLGETSAELDRLERGVQLIKVQSVDRLGRFNVFAGILWAAFFWFVGSRLLSPSVSTEVFRESAVPVVFGGAAFFALMSVSAAYAAAVRIVFLALDFALLDAKTTTVATSPAPSNLRTDAPGDGL